MGRPSTESVARRSLREQLASATDAAGDTTTLPCAYARRGTCRIRELKGVFSLEGCCSNCRVYWLLYAALDSLNEQQ